MNSQSPRRLDTRSPKNSAFRRWGLFALGVGGIAAGLGLPYLLDGDGSGTDRNSQAFLANSLLRIGIVMMALWLALPTLSRPLNWLPPGLAVIGLVAIGAIAAQPRLIVLILPALGILLSLRWISGLIRTASRNG